MSTTPGTPTATRRREAGASGRMAGLTLFAGVVMITAGVLHVLTGIAAIVRDEVFAVRAGYVYAFDLTGWGWAQLVLGVLVAAAGLAVLGSRSWAGAVGIFLAAMSLVANFMFIPYQPVWVLLISALDVTVIWALARQRQPVT